MAKKISKTQRKNKLTRSSSIDKTINQGNDYVKRSDQRKRIRKAKQSPTLPKNTNHIKNKTSQVTKPQKPTKKINKTTIRSASVVPSSPIVPGPAPKKSNSKQNQLIEQELHYRLNKNNANIGKLNFSLRWWDPNDLDLHVVCPCGTQIFYGNKKCNKCGGELDIDMNNFTNTSLQPVEHVFFKKPKPGLYKFFVQYYFGPKEYSGVKGGAKSKYALSLHEDLQQIFRYQDTVSNEQKQIHYDFSR